MRCLLPSLPLLSPFIQALIMARELQISKL
jgi:hypothetical protein